MSNGSSSLLKLFLVILLLIIAGELTCFYFISKNSNKNAISFNNPSLSPTVNPEPVNKNLFYVLSAYNQQKTLFDNKILINYKVKQRFKGYISKINKLDGNFECKSVYELLIKVNKDEVLPFYWSNKDVSLTKIYELISGIKKPIGFDDLQIGNLVEIGTTLDMLIKNVCVRLEEAEIIKL